MDRLDFAASHLKPGRWGWALGHVVVPLAAFGLTLLVIGALIGFGGATAIAIMAALVAAYLGPQLVERKGGPGSIALDENAIRITDETGLDRVVGHDAIASGCEWPMTSSVELALKDGSSITLDLRDPERLLAHVGVGVAHRTFTFALRRELGALTTGLAGCAVAAVVNAIVARSSAVYLLGIFVVAPIFGVVIGLRFGRPRVTVGADGIRVRGGLAGRFVPYKEVVSVGKNGSSVLISVRNGPELRLPLFTIPEIAAGIFRRIEQSRRAAEGHASRATTALARGSSSVEDWRLRVTKLGQAPAGFRDQAIELADLERVISDPSVKADERIGAAIAYRAGGGEPAHIRIAAAASADDAMRDALEAAAEEEPDLAVIERATRR